MPTLVRFLTTIGILFALGYGALYAVATFLTPEPREIVQAVAMPQDANLKTGRSAATALDSQARRLAPKH